MLGFTTASIVCVRRMNFELNNTNIYIETPWYDFRILILILKKKVNQSIRLDTDRLTYTETPNKNALGIDLLKFSDILILRGIVFVTGHFVPEFLVKVRIQGQSYV
jgi:hypothetical protein